MVIHKEEISEFKGMIEERFHSLIRLYNIQAKEDIKELILYMMRKKDQLISVLTGTELNNETININKVKKDVVISDFLFLTTKLSNEYKSDFDISMRIQEFNHVLKSLKAIK